MKVLGKSAVRQVGRCQCGLTATEQLLRWCERHSRSETVTFQNTDRSVSHCPDSGRFNGKPSRWHEGNPSLWVVANPCDAEPMKVWSLISLPIEPNVCRPENRSRPCRQIQVEGIMQADTPRIRPLNKFRPISRRLKKQKMLVSETKGGVFRFLGLANPQATGSNSQRPVERHHDLPSSRLNISEQLQGSANEQRVLTWNFSPQHCEGCVRNQPIHSLFCHFRKASLCSTKISNRLNGLTFCISLHISRNSRIKSFAAPRSNCRHFLRVFSGSSQPMTGISFPSTTIVPTTFGLRERFRFSAIYLRLLFPSQFCHQWRFVQDEICNGGDCQ